MRGIFSLVLVLMLVTACQNDDEILPAPPPAVNIPSPDADSKPADNEVQPPFDADSEMFQQGDFEGMPFRILFPRGYDSAIDYPMHIFLHGIGERGKDNEKQLTLGAPYFQVDSIRENYPAFIVFPQCPDSQLWFNTSMTEALKGLIDSLKEHQSIDEQAVSIGGFSMGAYGTFAMVARYPEVFKSAVAISGDGDESKASIMSGSRWRLFAGERDDVVPSYKTANMARALSDAGASVAFTLYPGADHGSTWFHAFSEPDFFYWLFASDNKGNEIAQRDSD